MASIYSGGKVCLRLLLLIDRPTTELRGMGDSVCGSPLTTFLFVTTMAGEAWNAAFKGSVKNDNFIHFQVEGRDDGDSCGILCFVCAHNTFL